MYDSCFDMNRNDSIVHKVHNVIIIDQNKYINIHEDDILHVYPISNVFVVHSII